MSGKIFKNKHFIRGLGGGVVYGQFKYESFLNQSFWPLNKTLTGVTMPCQSGPGINGNEGVVYIPQISRTEALTSDAYQGHSVWVQSGGGTSQQGVQSAYSKLCQ